MWSNPKRNVALLCVSTNDQIMQSNVVPPIQDNILSEPVKTLKVQHGVKKTPNGIMSATRMQNLASVKDMVSRVFKFVMVTVMLVTQ